MAASITARTTARACSICSATSSTVTLCVGCACLFVCPGCARSHHPTSSNDCIRLGTNRQAAVDGGFYDFPFAWYPPASTRFESIVALLEYLGVARHAGPSVVARLLAPPEGLMSTSTRLFPAGKEREDVRSFLEAFWGAPGNEYFLGQGSFTARPRTQISDWRSYVEARPAAGLFPLILDSSMSIYTAVRRYVSLATKDGSVPEKIKIALLGAEARHEPRYWPTFLELFNVLPEILSIHIVMIGPELPSMMDGLRCSADMGDAHDRKVLTVEMRRAACEDDRKLLAESHVLCALNAGLAAYHTWDAGLRAIDESNFRGIFLVTDYVEESLHEGRKALVRVFGDGSVERVTINPFRRPDACVRPTGHAMPSCGSNAFRCFVNLMKE